MPSPAAVLTISAPNMLLSASLNSFLLGLGIYLAYVWTRNLDTAAGAIGSRAVFLTYIVSLTVCYGIYELSGLVVAGQDYTSKTHMPRRENMGPGDMPMRQLRPDEERPESPPAPAEARGFTGPAGKSRALTTQDELVEALKTAAQKRRESAAADERIAELYERLSQQ